MNNKNTKQINTLFKYFNTVITLLIMIGVGYASAWFFKLNTIWVTIFGSLLCSMFVIWLCTTLINTGAEVFIHINEHMKPFTLYFILIIGLGIGSLMSLLPMNANFISDPLVIIPYGLVIGFLTNLTLVIKATKNNNQVKVKSP